MRKVETQEKYREIKRERRRMEGTREEREGIQGRRKVMYNVGGKGGKR